MKKIVIVTSVEQTLNAFFLNHLKFLKKKFRITLISNFNKDIREDLKEFKLININFSRKINFFSDIINFFNLSYKLFIINPNLLLSVTPKVGLFCSILSFFLRIQSVHYFTGQVWKNKKFPIKNIFIFFDKIIVFFSNRILVDSFSQFNYLLINKINIKRKGSVLLKGSISGVNLSKFYFSRKDRKDIRNKYNIGDEEIIIIFLGRINKEKGILELIEYFNHISINNNFDEKIYLFLVGHQDDDTLINYKRNNDNIIYIENNDYPEKFLSASDIFCLPSKREGFGTSVIEASACNLPVICSNIYGLIDAVEDKQTGLLFNIEDKNDFAIKMKMLIENKGLRLQLGNAGRKRVEKYFDANKSSITLLNYLQELI